MPDASVEAARATTVGRAVRRPDGRSVVMHVDPLPFLPELRLLGRVRTPRAGQRSLGMHRHHELELAHVVRGTVRWSAHGRWHVLGAGESFLTMPATPHGGGNDTLQPSEVLWMRVALPLGDGAEFMRCTASETASLVVALRPLDGTVIGPSTEIGNVLARLLEAIHEGDAPAAVVRMRAGVLHLLHLVIDSARLRRAVSEATLRGVRIMKSELGTRLPVADVARAVGLSASHFQRVFRAEMGVGPADFHLHLRLAEGCRQLAETDDNIVTIAMNLGFASSQHFATSFRKTMGTSPREYRAMSRDPATRLGGDEIPWCR